ncbi:MAG: dolichyl-phosphate-mannose--protein mannosyltransferase, partial [Pseudoflavonifractor sp.]
SRWYQWIVDGRPILYYLDSSSRAAEGLKSAFGAFSNPIVCWAGLPALLLCAAQSFRRKWSKGAFFLLSALCAAASLIFVDGILSPALTAAVRTRNLLLLLLGILLYLGFGVFAVRSFPRCSAKALFILVGYLSQLVPWLAIGRTTFEYHYFPSILFLVLALCYVMNDLLERRTRGGRIAVYSLTGGAVLCYAAFYPVLTGLFVPAWYTTNLLQWLPSWPF